MLVKKCQCFVALEFCWIFLKSNRTNSDWMNHGEHDLCMPSEVRTMLCLILPPMLLYMTSCLGCQGDLLDSITCVNSSPTDVSLPLVSKEWNTWIYEKYRDKNLQIEQAVKLPIKTNCNHTWWSRLKMSICRCQRHDLQVGLPLNACQRQTHTTYSAYTRYWRYIALTWWRSVSQAITNVAV
jgi:hypothetical protein